MAAGSVGKRTSPGPRFVVLTGAGVSADSGVATFRDQQGVWSRHDLMQVATPEAFDADPAHVHAFYNERRRALMQVEPNQAHRALARLEAALRDAGGALTLVTQNVDDLHERAGSTQVFHMHGELLSAMCVHCGARHRWAGDLGISTQCPDCLRPGGMRPDVVWFGEIPRHMDEIAEALGAACQFVSIGTSGSVYPAAGFVFQASRLGIPCTELNLEPSENTSAFDTVRYGPAASIVPTFVDEVLRTL